MIELKNFSYTYPRTVQAALAPHFPAGRKRQVRAGNRAVRGRKNHPLPCGSGYTITMNMAAKKKAS